MFWFILIAGVVLYFVLKGKSDRPEVMGAPKRGMGSGPLEPHTFVCPYPKCGACGAPPDKMRQEWDGLRTVKWTCGYCANLAGTQELRDEELPPSARRRLGLDQPPLQPGFQSPGYGRSGGGAGDLLTGLMIGSMMGGDHHHHHHDGGGSGSDWSGSQGSDSNGGWSDSGNESWGDSGDSGGGSDFGDSGGGDSGGSDW